MKGDAQDNEDEKDLEVIDEMDGINAKDIEVNDDTIVQSVLELP